MHFRQLAAIAASISFVSALRGFNTGNTQIDGSPKQQSDFAAEFQNQRELAGTDGAFTAARLYTMIQAGTTNTPISAIPAAIASNTKLLLGLWGSAGQPFFDQELDALRSAIQQYGPAFTNLVTGISVGSEDLYRITEIGIENGSPVGAGPDTIASFVRQCKSAISGTSLSDAPVGHVDTWTAWVNGSNSAVVDACDFVGVNQFPYYQLQQTNGIAQAKGLFNEALSNTRSAAGGKPVWVTETGWPWQGPTVGLAVANKQNARTYWKEVYCTLPADVNLFWYAQKDGNAGDKATFGLSNNLSPQPAFDLSCDDIVTSSSSASASATSHMATATSHRASATGLVGGAGSSGNGSGNSDSSGSGSDAIPTATDTTVRFSTTAAPYATANGTGLVYSTGFAQSTGFVSSAVSTVAVAAGTGVAEGSGAAAATGATATPSSTNTPFAGNSASSVQSTFALLAIPLAVAFML